MVGRNGSVVIMTVTLYIKVGKASRKALFKVQRDGNTYQIPKRTTLVIDLFTRNPYKQ